jgi:hypothetical protein
MEKQHGQAEGTSSMDLSSMDLSSMDILYCIEKQCEHEAWAHIKGSVQRKLRWVENGVNKSVGASDCGAGHSFVVLFGFHLGFTIFHFRSVLPKL